MTDRFFQNALEDGFKQVGASETADIVFPEGGEMGNGFGEVVTDKPTVSDIGFDFFDGLPHGTDAKEVLNEDNFDEDHRVDAGTPGILAVFIFNQVINETEVDRLVNFAEQMVLWNQLVERENG